MELATSDLFRARWSADIHEEWIRSAVADHPHLTRQKLDRVRELMDDHVPDALVCGYEDLIPGLALPDPGDCHVLAAAIRCNAGVIVTFNLRDFPEACLDKHHLEAQHPDEFVLSLMDLDPGAVCAAAGRMKDRWKRFSASREEFLDKLRRAGFPKTVDELRRRCPSLA